MLAYELQRQKLCKLHSAAIQFFVAFTHTFCMKWRSRHLWSAIFGANLPAFLCTHIVRTQLVNTNLGSARVLHQRINTSYDSYSRPWGDRPPQLLVSAVFGCLLRSWEAIIPYNTSSYPFFSILYDCFIKAIAIVNAYKIDVAIITPWRNFTDCFKRLSHGIIFSFPFTYKYIIP